jgi:hypothetical protein
VLCLPYPLIEDEKKEDEGKQTNRCEDDESHGLENGTCEVRRATQYGEFDELSSVSGTNIAK